MKQFHFSFNFQTLLNYKNNQKQKKCCRNTDKSNPGCQTRTVAKPGGKHEPTPQSLARAKEVAEVGNAEHARLETIANAERAQPEAAAAAGTHDVVIASGPVQSGPFRGLERAAALQSLNTAFARDVARFVEEASPDSVDLSSCMRQYLGLSAEIKGI